MLFQEDRTPIVPKGKKNHGEWPENYFAEFDPAARKAILDKQRNEEVDETLECLEKLFALRYKQDKKGNYADQFLGQFLQLRITAENLDAMFSERKNRKTDYENRCFRRRRSDGSSTDRRIIQRCISVSVFYRL